jgi:hypothetical protein
VQRKVTYSADSIRDGDLSSIPEESTSSRVIVSPVMAQKIRTLSDSFGIPEEILAVEAIRRGLRLLEK